MATYTPEATASYENLIKLEYERQCGGVFFEKGVPLDVRITAYFGIPKSVSKRKRQLMLDHKIRPTKKPDTDNIVKCFLDAGNGVAYQDDIQVTDLTVRKFYSDQPCVVVTIQAADDF